VNAVHQDYHRLISPGGLWTKAGARGDDPQYALLASCIEPISPHKALDLNPGIGIVAKHMQQHWSVQAIETSCAALRCLEKNLSSSPSGPGHTQAVHQALSQATLGLPWDTLPDSVGCVALVLPAHRGSAYVDACLAGAAKALQKGGRLWIAGSKDKGFERYFKKAQALLGYGLVVKREGPYRVAVIEKEHTHSPGRSDPPEMSQSFEANGHTFWTLPGVFSAGHLDEGSQMLLDQLLLEPRGSLGQVLDLGGGIGTLGIPLLAGGLAERVVMLEDDWVSILCAHKNRAALSNPETLEPIFSDVDYNLTKDQTFTIIISNPPFHVGGLFVLETAKAFLAVAHARLERGGRFYLVANRFLAYEPLLAELFTEVTTLAMASHKVLLARK
jgi:16S rRNA (guanine1207-N2)-methyltransferase